MICPDNAELVVAHERIAELEAEVERLKRDLAEREPDAEPFVDFRRSDHALGGVLKSCIAEVARLTAKLASWERLADARLAEIKRLVSEMQEKP